jgi:ADP-ribosylglycohydrolase
MESSILKPELIGDKVLDRVEGMLLAAALADSYGAPSEFCKPAMQPIMCHRTRIPSRFQGVRYLECGQPTDDTEMTLALCHALISGSGYDADRVALAYMAWANDGTFAMGRNTRALFKGVTTLKGFQSRCCKNRTTACQSNGALMRCCPLVLLPDGQRCVSNSRCNRHGRIGRTPSDKTSV